MHRCSSRWVAETNAPYVPGLRRADWSLQDPKGLSMEEVRTIRDEIKRRVVELLAVEQLGS